MQYFGWPIYRDLIVACESHSKHIYNRKRDAFSEGEYHLEQVLSKDMVLRETRRRLDEYRKTHPLSQPQKRSLSLADNIFELSRSCFGTVFAKLYAIPKPESPLSVRQEKPLFSVRALCLG